MEDKKNNGLKLSMEDERKRWHFKENMDDEKKNHGLERSMEDKKMMLFERKYG